MCCVVMLCCVRCCGCCVCWFGLVVRVCVVLLWYVMISVGVCCFVLASLVVLVLRLVLVYVGVCVLFVCCV